MSACDSTAFRTIFQHWPFRFYFPPQLATSPLNHTHFAGTPPVSIRSFATDDKFQLLDALFPVNVMYITVSQVLDRMSLVRFRD